MNSHRPVWRKSSHSGGDNGNCVEIVGSLDRLRDSKNPTGPAVRGNLTALVAAVKADQIC